jgi:anion-transporting  ArsA/GET3 family ATPase
VSGPSSGNGHRTGHHGPPERPSLDSVLATARTVVTAGAGGVGKTTLAAAIAVEGARRGRKVVVVTIDPARRLADALGLAELTNSPRPVDGDWPGELSALMLDAGSTFDALVVKYAAEPGQAERILANRFYRNIAGALSGTQEYMAMEKLFELHHEHDFDLVVVDTPPSRHALDFLDAPARLTRFLDHKLYRVLMAPSRRVMRALNVAAFTFTRTMSKVVGGEVVDDAMRFFAAFAGMEDGFKERAQAMLALLADPSSAFVVVTSPRADTVTEAEFFIGRLEESGLPVRALVVNRVHPRFGSGPAAEARAQAEALAGTDLGDLYANLADFRTVSAHEDDQLAGITERVAPAPVVRVPFLDTDIHDLDGLLAIGRHL